MRLSKIQVPEAKLPDKNESFVQGKFMPCNTEHIEDNPSDNQSKADKEIESKYNIESQEIETDDILEVKPYF